MTREELVEASKSYFESHPKEEMFFATSDGMFFTNQSRSDGAAHASHLKCELHVIRREESQLTSEAAKLAEEAAALAEEQRIAEEAAEAIESQKAEEQKLAEKAAALAEEQRIAEEAILKSKTKKNEKSEPSTTENS